jgi:hypothetical protein
MANSQLDLASIFQAVSGTLAQNQNALNEADTYNHDHGTNMVDVFKTISKAVGEKQGKDTATQLKYAGEQLLKGQHSGSAEMYGKNLLDAAQQFKGKQLTAENGMQVVQALLGAQQPPQQEQPAAGGLLGSLLGGLTGNASSGGGLSDGLDAGDLLTAGMAFLQSKQQGDSTGEALLDAVVAASSAGQSAHRAQSGKLVASSLLQALGSFGK